MYRKILNWFKPKPSELDIWAIGVYVKVDVIRLLKKLDVARW